MKIQRLINWSMTIILAVHRLAFVRSFTTTVGFPPSRGLSTFLRSPGISSHTLTNADDVTNLPICGIHSITCRSSRRKTFISSSSRTLLHSVANPSSGPSSNREKVPNGNGSNSKANLDAQRKSKQTKNKESNTGGLRRLPVIKSPAELINRTRNVAKRVKADVTVKNARNRARKHAAETLNAVTQELCVPLRDVVKGYKYELSRLHPFEKVVADLTARSRQKKDGLVLQDVLDEINEARKEMLIAGKDWIAKAKNAETARDAMDFMREGEGRLYELFEELASKSVKLLIELQKDLRTTPAVRLDTPAVVLVGAPNVGKSSIVRAISSATPEVNNYPFTTRGMTLGHVQVFWNDETTAAAAIIPEVNEVKKGRFDAESLSGNYAFTQLCQVMDSPGLLARDDSVRNEMEALTLAAMQHLPTAVMYVMDLSGGAGDKCSSVSDQLQLRREVRARFPRRPWIDVVSKCDLGLVDGAREELEEVLDGAPYIELSIKDGLGVDELRDEVMRMLGEVRVVLDAMAAVDARNARPSRQRTSP
jgi:Predicted GTPase